MMSRVASVIGLLAAIVLAACGQPPTGGAASPTPSEDSTVETVASATPSLSLSPAPTATQAASAQCEPREVNSAAELLAEAPDGWGFWEADDGFAFGYPGEWSNMSGVVSFRAGTLIDGETLAETGLDSGAEMHSTFVHGPGENFPNFSVFVFPGVTSSLEEVYDRQEARFTALPDVNELFETRQQGCLGGVPYLGLTLSFTEDEAFQRSLFSVRDGTLFHVQWLDVDDGELALLDDILATWGWLATAGGDATDDGASAETAVFHEAHVSDIALSGPEPDTSTFGSTFSADSSRICAIYRVTLREPDTVTATWNANGVELFEHDNELGTGSGWAWMCINPPREGFEVGSWEVELAFDGSGDAQTVAFSFE